MVWQYMNISLFLIIVSLSKYSRICFAGFRYIELPCNFTEKIIHGKKLFKKIRTIPFLNITAKIWGPRPAGLGGDRERANMTVLFEIVALLLVVVLRVVFQG
jgi:hypothetical protein